MLLAHPAVLSDLVDRHETLRLLDPADPEVRRRLADVSYTLCVATGTRDVDAALIAARRRLRAPGARPEDHSVPA